MQNAVSLERQAANENQPTYVVTLVHGTFVPNANWIREGSRLRRAIESGIEGSVVFQPFVWPGKYIRQYNNTHQDRHAAALGLRQHLRSVVSQYPDAKHFVIAHSHGGNVAVEALRDTGLTNRIHGLVCLATPFFTAERSARDKYIAFVADGMRKFGWLAFLLVVSLVAVTMDRRLAFVPILLGEFLPSATVMFVTKGFNLFCLVTLLGGAFAVWKWGRDWINHIVGPWLVRRQNEVAKCYDTTHLENIPVLSVYVKRDEAQLGLRAERWVERAMTHGYRWSVCGAFLLSTLLCGVLIAASAGTLCGSITTDSSSTTMLLSLVFLVGAVSMAAGSYVLMALLFLFIVLWPLIVGAVASLLRTPIFGWESIIDNWLFRCDVATSPSPHATVREYNLRAWIRHNAIYERPEVLADVTKWLHNQNEKEMVRQQFSGN